jgi:hypothetical protein
MQHGLQMNVRVVCFRGGDIHLFSISAGILLSLDAKGWKPRRDGLISGGPSSYFEDFVPENLHVAAKFILVHDAYFFTWAAR